MIFMSIYSLHRVSLLGLPTDMTFSSFLFFLFLLLLFFSFLVLAPQARALYKGVRVPFVSYDLAPHPRDLVQ